MALYWRGCGWKLVWTGYYELLNFVCLGIYDVLLVNMNLCIIPLHNISKIEKLVLNIFELIVEFPRFTKE